MQTDDKPLEIFIQKLLCKAPARLQGMLLQLQRYDLNITYTAGKHMYVADTLSRATVERKGEDENSCEERVVYALEATDALSEETLAKLREATTVCCKLCVKNT